MNISDTIGSFIIYVAFYFIHSIRFEFKNNNETKIHLSFGGDFDICLRK